MRENEVSVKFYVTITSVYESIIWLLISFALFYWSMGLGYLILLMTSLICILLINLATSKLLNKKIFKRNNSLVFKNGLFKYKLDPGKMRVCYEKVSVWGGNFKDYYGLVLYRDIDKIVGLSFNNKFVLAYEIDEVKLAFYKKEFEAKLGIEINTVDSIW